MYQHTLGITGLDRFSGIGVYTSMFLGFRQVMGAPMIAGLMFCL